jgi:DNA primase
LRQQLSLHEVLDLVGWKATTRRGPQLRGPCPVHGSVSRHSRSFAAHVAKNCWHCFRCGAGGNALDLYLAVTKLPVYEGALELCARLHISAPRLPTAGLRGPAPRSPPP